MKRTESNPDGGFNAGCRTFRGARSSGECPYSQRLIVLDFAGTLSLQTVLFGRKSRLERALRRSGLVRLGFRDPARFWEELVFPTWEEGGLTSKGYAEVLTRRIRELRRKTETREAAQNFVHLYFQHSWIDPGWKGLFTGALFCDEHPISTPKDTLLIATDHYAECTLFLCRFLRRWGVMSQPVLGRIHLSSQAAPVVLIANSADLGAWKKDPSFWGLVNGKLPLDTFQRILLIDDFGYNEHRGDPYADRMRVEQRRDSILRCLTSQGASKVEVFPFFLESSVTDAPIVDLYEEYRTLLGKTFLFLRNRH